MNSTPMNQNTNAEIVIQPAGLRNFELIEGDEVVNKIKDITAEKTAMPPINEMISGKNVIRFDKGTMRSNVLATSALLQV